MNLAELTPKRIGVIAIFIALLGFVPELMFIWKEINLLHAGARFFHGLFTFVYLSWLGEDFRFLGVEVLNTGFYILLLISGIIYLLSDYRETRLLRFLFAVIWYSKVAYWVFSFFWFVGRLLQAPDDPYSGSYSGGQPGMSGTDMALFIFQAIFQIGWIYLIYRIIKQLQAQKRLLVVENQYGDTIISNLVDASSWQRLFHLLVDALIALLIFSRMGETLFRMEGFRQLVNGLADLTSDRFALVITIGFFRALFYIPFETLLGATPAKLLSETRVVDENGEKPGLSSIIIRTFSRFVPLEALSFLWNSRWHDSWSRTNVVQEERQGVKGGYYLLIIPVFVVAGLGGYAVLDNYERYLWAEKQKETGRLRAQDLLYQLDHITENDFIELQEGEYSHDKVFLKVEKVLEDSLLVSRLVMPDEYNGYFSHFEIEKQFEESQNYVDKYRLNKATIREAIETEPEDPDEQRLLQVLDKEYSVKAIESHFGPHIRLGSYNSYSGNRMILEFENAGWAADLVQLKAPEGNIQFSNTLPARIPSGYRRNEGVEFVVAGTINDPQGPVKFNLTLQDTLGRRHVYEVVTTDAESGHKSVRKLK